MDETLELYSAAGEPPGRSNARNWFTGTVIDIEAFIYKGQRENSDD